MQPPESPQACNNLLVSIVNFHKRLLPPEERRWRAGRGGGIAWSGLNTDSISLIATERISIRPGLAGDHQHYRDPPTGKTRGMTVNVTPVTDGRLR